MLFRSICPDFGQIFLAWEPHFCPNCFEALTGIIQGPRMTSVAAHSQTPARLTPADSISDPNLINGAKQTIAHPPEQTMSIPNLTNAFRDAVEKKIIPGAVLVAANKSGA